MRRGGVVRGVGGGLTPTSSAVTYSAHAGYPSHAMTSKRSWDLPLVAALLAVTAAVYARALGVGFFSDDWEWLGRMNATLDRPAFVFTVFYRDFNPVLHASFVVDWIAGGGRAVAFHLQSLALHLVNTALLFLLCRRLSGSAPVAAAAALAWAVNVRLSEAVIWPAARGHELATLFALAALLALGSRWRASGAVATGLFVLGLLSKETALLPLAAFPFLLPDWRRARWALAAMAAAGAAFVAFKVVSTPSLHTTPAPLGDVVRKVPFLVLRPLGLGDLYSFTWPACLAVLALVALAAWWLRRGAALGGFVWVAAATIPIVPLDKLSSRYLYLPAAGWSIVLCAVIARIAPRLASAAARRAAAVAGIAALGLLVAGNALDVGREIEDYALLAAPYDALAAALRGPLGAVEPGGSVVVVATGPGDTIAKLAASVAERGTITKLIPHRTRGIDGLIELRDLLNATTPRRPGSLAGRVPPEEARGGAWIAWDGRTARRLSGPPDVAIPTERLFAARWGSAPYRVDE